MHCIMTRVKSQNGVKHKSSVNLYYVAVHIDLKGSPPKMTYLASLLPTLSMYGVNAILLEYEDMFPYVGSIANISSVNAYKRNEVSFEYNKDTCKFHFGTNPTQSNVITLFCLYS